MRHLCFIPLTVKKMGIPKFNLKHTLQVKWYELNNNNILDNLKLVKANQTIS